MSRKITIACLMTVMTTLCAVQPALAQNNLLKKDPLPSSRILNRFGLERSWWGQATINSSRDKILHVAIDERTVIMLASSGIVTAFDAENGQKLWVTRVGRNDQLPLMPVMNQTQVLVVSGLKLYAIDRLKGGVTWEISLPKVPSTAPSADDKQIYIGTLDGSVFAFNLKTIKELYQERLLPEYSLTAQAWRYKSGKRITSPPVVTGRSVSFASLDNSLYSVSAFSRRLLYQFETNGPITAPIVKHGPHLFIASEDFNFYCLNAENGKVQWSFLSGLPIRKSPYVIGQQVFVLPENGGMVALQASNGRLTWPKAQKQAVDFHAATDRLIFASDAIGNVLLIDRENGEKIGTLPLLSFNIKPNNSLTDRLFLAKENGLIVMIREKESTFPTYHQNPQQRPLLPELYDPQAAAEQPTNEKPPEPGEK